MELAARIIATVIITLLIWVFSFWVSYDLLVPIIEHLSDKDMAGYEGKLSALVFFYIVISGGVAYPAQR